VAILGTATGAAAVTDYHHAWVFMGSCALLSCLILQGIGRKVKVARPSVEVFVAERETYALAVSK
jgi:hypothetical protein